MQAGQTDPPIVEAIVPTNDSGPNAIVSAPGGVFWFAEYSAGQIGKYVPANGSNPFLEYKIPEVNATPATIAFNQQTGTVWFTDQKRGAGSIWMLDPATLAFTRFNLTVPNSIPVHVLVDSQNNVWFTELVGNKLGKLSYPSYSLTEYTLPTANSGPAELAFQNWPQGQLIVWITETYAYKVARFDSAATNANPWREYTSSIGIRSPVGIVVDNKGSVWFSEHGGSAIVKLDPSTSLFTKYPTSLTRNVDISAPATLNLDASGRLWFVEHFLNRVGRLDPVLNTIDEFNIPTSGSSLLAYSLQSTLDEVGNFYFTEYYANKIGMVPSNASVPISMKASPGPVVDTAGATITIGFSLSNNLSVQLLASLAVSSSFTLTGATSPNLARVNATSVDLGPVSTRALSLTVTPDLLSAPGLYSVSVSATYGNSSSVGVSFVQVSPSAAGVLVSNLAVIGGLAAVAAGGVLLYSRRRKPKLATATPGAPEKHHEGLARLTILVISLLVLLHVVFSSQPGTQLPPYVNAKCPGLPPPPPTFNGSQSIDYAEILDIATITFFVLVLLLALRKWYRGRKAKKTG